MTSLNLPATKKEKSVKGVETMKTKSEGMKELINGQYRQMLWKDECGDDFLITKFCEIYRRSKGTIKLVVFDKKFRRSNLSLLKERGIVLDEWETDDNLLLLDVDKRYLSLIISFGMFKRRPNKNGKWIKDKEQRLAHKIYAFNPNLKEEDNH